MRWMCAYCLMAIVHSEISINFELISTNEDPMQQDALSEAIISRNLSKPLNMQLDVVYLNASIIFGVCAPGYFWDIDTCRPCECPWHDPSDVQAVWFEPM